MGWFRPKKAVAAPRTTVREADTRDLEGILVLLQELVADKVPRRARKRYLETMRHEQRRMLLDPEAVWFVAERTVPREAGARGPARRELVGCARATLHHEHPLLAYLQRRDYGYIFGVFVGKSDRRTGTGATLMAKCEGWLRSRGARWAFLHSTVDGIPFYEALDYEPSLEFGKRIS